MKKLIFLIFAFLILFSANLFAADTTNTQVNWKEYDNGVLYYGPATFPAAAGTDNCFTQAMAIDFADRTADIYAWLQCYATEAGTEDANGYVEFSNSTTATTFYSTTDSDLDAIGTTVVKDTIGVAVGALDGYRGSIYMRLKFDGQTGNENGLSMNWYVWIPKAANAPKRGCAGAYDTE